MFITFEGIEGSGKSTVISSLATYLLEERGLDVLLTREPGGCSLGMKLRTLLLDTGSVGISPTAELFLYLADRAQHVKEVIKPALTRGAVVLCDRYIDSTIAYQGYGRGLDVARLQMLCNIACEGLLPNFTLLFDLDAEVGLARAKARNKLEGKELSEGRFEAEELVFHEKVRKGYLELAGQDSRYRIIDAEMTQEDVLKAASHVVLQALKLL